MLYERRYLSPRPPPKIIETRSQLYQSEWWIRFCSWTTASWKACLTVFWRSTTCQFFQTNPIQTQTNLWSIGETWEIVWRHPCWANSRCMLTWSSCNTTCAPSSPPSQPTRFIQIKTVQFDGRVGTTEMRVPNCKMSCPKHPSRSAPDRVPNEKIFDRQVYSTVFKWDLGSDRTQDPRRGAVVPHWWKKVASQPCSTWQSTIVTKRSVESFVFVDDVSCWCQPTGIHRANSGRHGLPSSPCGWKRHRTWGSWRCGMWRERSTVTGRGSLCDESVASTKMGASVVEQTVHWPRSRRRRSPHVRHRLPKICRWLSVKWP